MNVCVPPPATCFYFPFFFLSCKLLEATEAKKIDELFFACEKVFVIETMAVYVCVCMWFYL